MAFSPGPPVLVSDRFSSHNLLTVRYLASLPTWRAALRPRTTVSLHRSGPASFCGALSAFLLFPLANRTSPLPADAILGVAKTATAQQIRDAYKRYDPLPRPVHPSRPAVLVLTTNPPSHSAALKNHPDRVPADSPEREARTRKFQLVNDAYYTLSDADRRKTYDAQQRLHGRRGYSFPDEDEDDSGDFPETGATGPGAGPGARSGASWAWAFFSKAASRAGGRGRGSSSGCGSANNQDHGPTHADNPHNTEEARQQAEDAQFADVFEEMLREEGMAEPGSGRPTGKFWSLLGGLSGGALGFIVANVPGMVAGAVAGNRLGAVRDAKGKSVYAVYQELPADDRAKLLGQLAVRVFSHAVGA